MRRLVEAGGHVRVVAMTPEQIELESAARLRPGQCVDVAVGAGGAATRQVRSAFVVSWAVVRLGKEGPVYRGICRWQ